MGIAGELGHIGINYNEKRQLYEHKGRLEQHAGTESLIQYISEMMYAYPQTTLTEKSTYSEIVNAYANGDALAAAAVSKLAWMLGYGLASVVFMINPDYIIVGKDYPDNTHFIDMVKKAMGEFVHPSIMHSLEIRASHMTEDSIMRGGYQHILSKRLKNYTLVERIKKIRDIVNEEVILNEPT